MRTEFVLSEVAIGLRRNLTMTLASIVVVVVTLTLLGLALIFSDGTSKTKKTFYGQLHVSVYFDLPCGTQNSTAACSTGDEQTSVRQILQALPEVKSITYISQAQAINIFKKENPDSPALLQAVGPNALPASLEVQLKDPKKYAIVKSAVGQAPGVQSVSDASQVLKSLFRFFDVVTIIVLFFAALLVATTILLIYNAMRVAAFTRRRETGIMRLVGASDMAIQVPFILEGTIIGVAGSAVAVILLFLSRLVIHHEFKNSAILREFGQLGTLGYALPFVIIIGVVLPSLASFLTLQRHLRV